MELFSRYREIVDDWGAFWDHLLKPQPKVIRVNRLKAPVEQVKERLEAQGFRLEPYPFDPHIFRVVGEPFSAGLTLEHWLGFFYIQEAAAAIPVLALEPEEGQSLLDLAAAPGGKTTQMAEILQDSGLVVANEPQRERLAALLENLSRLGVTRAGVVRGDGRRFPQGFFFDGVLVDAPCSAEGNIRRDPAVKESPSPKGRRRLAILQKELLKKALSLVKEGGRVVYSTCTFAPEENEGVVDQVVREAKGAVAIEAWPENLPGMPGITRWEGDAFLPELEHTRRLYPHHLDSGGMYVARLCRLGPLPWEEEGEKALPWFRGDRRLPQEIGASWAQSFGVEPSLLEGYFAYSLGDEIGLSRLEEIPRFPGLLSAGMPTLKKAEKGYRLLPQGAVHFLKKASDRTINLAAPQILSLLEGREISLAGL
ncbi:MAG: NOL1/NOP2/sun family putative RNA methylase, partial [Bacillota bacterium]|nr:NOL1/NOP2/sun family putative RNA methylase [Bacillota bacterium]